MVSAPTSEHEDIAGLEVIQSTQALEPGHYWIAQRPLERRFNTGDTLLLMDVTEFDGATHSVTLRMHPRQGSGKFDMLVHDFLAAFLPNPDGESVRLREQQEVMERVAEQQSDLMRIQVDPQLMNEAIREKVEAGLRDLAKEQAATSQKETEQGQQRAQDIRKVHRRAARRSAANGNPLTAPKVVLANELGDFIHNGINEQGIAELKHIASSQAVIARAQATWLQERTEAIAATLAQLTPYVSERSAVALARASGAIKMAERIGRGIESLDLYVGKNVDVIDLKVGAPAATHEPLSLIQGKRYAEEELAVWADVDASFDFTNRQAFFDAMAESEALVNQVLPFPRCVVSMAMTRHSRDYGDAMSNVMNNIQNQLVFLLVRNGANVHVVYSSSPSHEGAARLFPTQNEAQEPFCGFDGERVSIRDVEFGERAKRFDDVALVYRRFLILLCGLDHRMGLLGVFYPPEMQARFMSAEFQARYFRFVADEEQGWLLGDQLPPVNDWFKAKNTMVQSGSRIFILNGAAMRAATPEIKRRHDLVATSEQFKTPFVAFLESGALAVTIQAKNHYSGRGPESPKCYISATGLNSAHDGAWWLCVDGVSAPEIRRYRHSRTNRAMGVSYLKLFRRLETYLELEAQQEAAARAYLLEAAVEFGGVTAEQAPAALDAAVRNWRAARRGAPLPDIDQKAELNGVLSLMVPEGHLTPQMEVMLAAYLSASCASPLLLTRTGRSKFFLYVPATDEDRAPFPNVLTWGWVKRISLEPGATKIREGSSSLVWLGEVLPAAEVAVRTWDGLQAWQNKMPEPIKLRRYASLVPLLAGSTEWEPVLRAGQGTGIPDTLFGKVLRSTLDINARNLTKRTIDVVLAIPVAVFSEDGRKLKVAYMQAYAASVMCFYGTGEQRLEVAKRLSRSPRQIETVRTAPSWRLVTSEADKFISHDVAPGQFVPQATIRPRWATQQIKVNRKGRRQKIGDRPFRGPSTEDRYAELSLDRAFAQLNGTAPVHFARAFYNGRKERASRVGSWLWSREQENEDATSRDARYKADRIRIMAATYEHEIKALLSPLIWSQEKNRSVANALFTAPLLKAGKTS